MAGAASYDIFISLRFNEGGKNWPLKAAQQLKGALETDPHNLKVFLCDVEAGADIFKTVCHAMAASTMFVIFGSETYGTDTGSKCCTYQELNFIIDEKKEFFLIKMCDKYKVATTLMTFNRDIAYEKWFPFESQALPGALLANIAKKFHGVRGTPQAVMAVASSTVAVPTPKGTVFVVSGADKDWFNGPYIQDGDYDGKAEFKRINKDGSFFKYEDSTVQIYYDDDNGWIAWNVVGYYHPDKNAIRPPTNGWLSYPGGQPVPNFIIKYIL